MQKVKQKDKFAGIINDIYRLVFAAFRNFPLDNKTEKMSEKLGQQKLKAFGMVSGLGAILYDYGWWIRFNC